MTPESTSPLPAVASAGTPARGEQHVAGPVLRRGDRREGPLEQDDGTQLGRQVPCGGQAVVAGRRPHQPGELAVVGREHGRVGPAGQELAGRAQVTQSGDGVGVHHEGKRGSGR